MTPFSQPWSRWDRQNPENTLMQRFVTPRSPCHSAIISTTRPNSPFFNFSSEKGSQSTFLFKSKFPGPNVREMGKQKKDYFAALCLRIFFKKKRNGGLFSTRVRCAPTAPTHRKNSVNRAFWGFFNGFSETLRLQNTISEHRQNRATGDKKKTEKRGLWLCHNYQILWTRNA